MIPYPAAYAVLRLTGFIVRGESCEYSDIMWGRSVAASRDSASGASAAYLDGNIGPWTVSEGPPDVVPVYVLRIFRPLIRAEFNWRNRTRPRL